MYLSELKIYLYKNIYINEVYLYKNIYTNEIYLYKNIYTNGYSSLIRYC